MKNKIYLGVDTEGIYYAYKTSFEGLTFYLNAQYKLEFILFGVKIVDWNPKANPDPITWSKCSLDWIRIYLNKTDDRVDFFNFNKENNE